jgi:hypothetical protein
MPVNFSCHSQDLFVFLIDRQFGTYRVRWITAIAFDLHPFARSHSVPPGVGPLFLYPETIFFPVAGSFTYWVPLKIAIYHTAWHSLEAPDDKEFLNT